MSGGRAGRHRPASRLSAALGAAAPNPGVGRESGESKGRHREQSEAIQTWGLRRRLGPDRVAAARDDGRGRRCLWALHGTEQNARLAVEDSLDGANVAQDAIDYSGLEYDGVFLEGTGAMVLDRAERVAYAARSNRCNEAALERFCTHFNFEPIVFDAFDGDGRPIYHTVVLMCVGGEVCLVGLETIENVARRDEVRRRLEGGGRAIVELSHRQIADFAGNAIELQGRDGGILAISSRGWRALSGARRRLVERCCRPLPLDVPTVERAGGSIRCMLAGLRLSQRSRIA
ncbi:MAG: arginine deiminase-related protein [Roseiarcus sp.]